MVRVEPFHYNGKVWCLKVPTGCFVAWRDGMAFPTGNSGFPKSMDISKAIDKAAGAEREVVGSYSDNNRKCPKHQSTHAAWEGNAVVNITAPATPEAQQWAGFGTALKPSLEPCTLARKPLQGTVAANVLQHGCGGLNVDGCRVGTGQESFDHIKGRPLMKINNCRTDEESLNGAAQQAALAKLKELGRWPANLIHDGSDEVVRLFPQAQGMQKATLRRGASTGASIGGNGKYGTAAPQEVYAGYGDTGSAARFFKQCKGYNEAWPDLPPEPANTAGNCSNPSRQAVASALSDAATWALPVGSCKSVSLAPSTSATAKELRQLSESVITAIQSIAPKFWQGSQPARLSLSLSHVNVVVQKEPTGITTITASHWKSDGSAEPVTFSIIETSTAAGDQDSAPRAFYTAKASASERQGVTHPTVKPLDLMRYLVRLVTPPGGIVLDPFMGSGTTIKAAISEGFRGIGIERDPEYYAMAQHRLNGAQIGLELF